MEQKRKELSPVIRHSDWDGLIEDLSSECGPMVRIRDGYLRDILHWVASIAWWLETFAPEVVEQGRQKGSLNIVLPGLSPDWFGSGQWLSLLPWMLGVPGLKTKVYVVGDERGSDGVKKSGSLGGRILGLHREWPAQAGKAATHEECADIFIGSMREWLSDIGPRVELDACIIFGPELTHAHEHWMSEESLGELLRSGIPLGFFGWSTMNALTDHTVLKMYGMDLEAAKLRSNPWSWPEPVDEYEERICAPIFDGSFAESFARVGWRCRAEAVPETPGLDEQAFEAFSSLLRDVGEECINIDGESCLDMAGMRVEGTQNDGSLERVIMLARGYVVFESTRVLGVSEAHCEGDDEETGRDERFYYPLAANIIAPTELIEARPDNDDVMGQILWGARTYLEWAIPELNKLYEENQKLKNTR